MAKYRVLERSFIGLAIVEPGEVVEYDGEVGDNLAPVSEPAEHPAPRRGRPPGPKQDAHDLV